MRGLVQQTAPAPADEKPGDVRGVGRQRADHGAVLPGAWSATAKRRPASSWPSRCGCGSPCCSPTSPKHGRRPRQGPGRMLCAAPSATSWPRNWTSRDYGANYAQGRRLQPCATAMWCWSRRRLHPRRRRGDRRRGLGGRERHHRRKRAGDPRNRRRFQLGHRRHAGAVRLAGGAHHRQSRRDLPGPHDRHGGRRQAPEDAQRDRADHPAGGADAHLPAGHRHAAAVLALQRRDGRSRDSRSPSPCWWRCWSA